MADFKSIRDSVIGTVANVAGKTKDLAGIAVDKAKDVSRIAKLNIELNSEKSIAEKAYTEIGKLYYETRKDNPDGFFVQLCDEISLAKGNIERIQAEIESVKAGNPDCDLEVEVDIEVVSDDEFEKEEKKSDGCSCGCSEHKEEPTE